MNYVDTGYVCVLQYDFAVRRSCASSTVFDSVRNYYSIIFISGTDIRFCWKLDSSLLVVAGIFLCWLMAMYIMQCGTESGTTIFLVGKNLKGVLSIRAPRNSQHVSCADFCVQHAPPPLSLSPWIFKPSGFWSFLGHSCPFCQTMDNFIMLFGAWQIW